MGIWFYCNFFPEYHIATEFCTWHNSTVFIVCAKFHSDQFIRIWMTARWNFHGNIVSEMGLRASLQHGNPLSTAHGIRQTPWAVHNESARHMLTSITLKLQSFNGGCQDIKVHKAIGNRCFRFYLSANCLKGLMFTKKIICSTCKLFEQIMYSLEENFA